MTRRAMSFDVEIVAKPAEKTSDRVFLKGIDGELIEVDVVASKSTFNVRKPVAAQAAVQIAANVDVSAWQKITDAFAGLAPAAQQAGEAIQSFASTIAQAPIVQQSISPLQTFTGQRFRLLNEAIRDGDGSFTVTQQAIAAFHLTPDDMNRWSSAYGFDRHVNVEDASVTFRNQSAQQTPQECVEFRPENSTLTRCRCGRHREDHSRAAIGLWSLRLNNLGRRRR